jgi:ABC-type polysaccharide/polyol phosphate transport system ATPase subunit
VAPRETLGISGHNGAGKSTIHKVPSRCHAPTAGEITSGSILDMRRRDVGVFV